MSPEKLPLRLKAAINTYFAFSREPHEIGTIKQGNFTQPIYTVGFSASETKERCCVAIDQAAQRHGYGLTIIAGTIWLARRGKTLEINRPIPL